MNTWLIVGAAVAGLLLLNGGSLAGILKKVFPGILGGGSKLDVNSLLAPIIAEFYECGQCTPEEEKQVEDAIAIMVNHVIRHRMTPSKDPALLRIENLERILANDNQKPN